MSSNCWYYIQLAKFKKHTGPVTGVDCLLNYEYMGSAEFEFGTLNQSLKDMAERVNELDIHRVNLVSNKNRNVFVICSSTEKDDVLKHIMNIYKNDGRFKEPTYFKYSLENDDYENVKRNYNTYELWWDIRRNFIFCLGKNNARNIIKGIKQYAHK